MSPVNSLTKSSMKDAVECDICKLSFVLIDIHYEWMHKSFRLTEYDKHRCSYCGVPLTKISDQIVHALIHENENIACYWCSAEMDSSEKLLSHIETHREAHVCHCKACQATFATMNELQTHFKMSCPTFTCLECRKVFPTALDLQNHLQLHWDEEERRRRTCKLCRKVFSKRSNYLHHLKAHYNLKIFQCAECNGTFVSKSSLRIHIKSTHLKLHKRKCKECGLFLRGSDLYQAHLMSHGLVPFFECHLCQKKFRYKKYIKNHVKEIICSICKEVFMCSELYQKHNSMHIAKCHICDKECNTFSILKWHVSFAHSGLEEKTIKCEVCDFSTVTKRNMLRHKTRKHGIYSASKESLKRRRKTMKKIDAVFSPKKSSNKSVNDEIKCEECLLTVCRNNFARHKRTHGISSVKKESSKMHEKTIKKVGAVSSLKKNSKKSVYDFSSTSSWETSETCSSPVNSRSNKLNGKRSCPSSSKKSPSSDRKCRKLNPKSLFSTNESDKVDVKKKCKIH